ncbi:hypothetical protein EJB05_01549, partial [Eragrostis curvula]
MEVVKQVNKLGNKHVNVTDPLSLPKEAEGSNNEQPVKVEQDNSHHQQEQLQLENQLQQAETNSFQLAEKETGYFGQQSFASSSVDVAHPSADQQNVKQTVAQQAPAGGQDTRKGPFIALNMLISILQAHLDRDKDMQLQTLWAKLRRNEVGIEDFLRVIRNIVGDQMLMQAAHRVSLQRYGPVQTSKQANPGQHSLFSQQIPSSVSERPTDQGTSSRGTKNARSPPALDQAAKRARTTADDSEAEHGVGLNVSKMGEAMSSAGATGGASAIGESHAGTPGGQKSRLPSWSEMLDRGFSSDLLSDPTTDMTSAFMHATIDCVASLKTVYNQYAKLLEAEASPSSAEEVHRLQHELAEERKNTMRLKTEKAVILTTMTEFSEKAEAHLVEVARLKKDIANLAASNDQLNNALKEAKEVASASQDASAALQSMMEDAFKSLNSLMEKLEMKTPSGR